MKKTLNLILILTVMLFSLTGCYNSIGIDKYYYIIALAIDSSENDLLNVSIQIANVSNEGSTGSSSTQSSSYKIYSVEAETIESAITILNNYLNKKINLSHCSALVFSEEIARNGLLQYLTSLSNNTELRHSCEILISSSTAYDVLDKVSNSGEVFSSRLFDYLTTSSDYTGYTVPSTFGTFFRNLQNSYRQPSAIYSQILDDTLQNSGVAVFKHDKMIGHLDVIDTIAHLMVTNELKTCELTFPSPFIENKKIDLNLKLYKNTEIDIDIVNNSPYISINVYPEGTILGSGETFNYTQNENIQKVEEATNSYIKEIIKEYFYKISKEFDADIAGIAGRYSSHFLTKEDFEAVHFEEIFKDSFFEINVKTQINSSSLFNKQ